MLTTSTTGVRDLRNIAREFLIDRRHPVLRVDDEQDHVALAHRRVGRRPNLRRQFRLARATDPARIPDEERPSARDCTARRVDRG